MNKIAAVFCTSAEKLAYEDVGRIHKHHVQFSKSSKRVNAVSPPSRKIMRLKVSEPQAVQFHQFIQEHMSRSNLRRHLVNHIDVVCLSNELIRQDQGDRTPDNNVSRLRQRISQVSQKLQNSFGMHSVHDASSKCRKAGRSKFRFPN